MPLFAACPRTAVAAATLPWASFLAPLRGAASGRRERRRVGGFARDKSSPYFPTGRLVKIGRNAHARRAAHSTIPADDTQTRSQLSSCAERVEQILLTRYAGHRHWRKRPEGHAAGPERQAAERAAARGYAGYSYTHRGAESAGRACGDAAGLRPSLGGLSRRDQEGRDAGCVQPASQLGWFSAAGRAREALEKAGARSQRCFDPGVRRGEGRWRGDDADAGHGNGLVAVYQWAFVPGPRAGAPSVEEEDL